MKGEFCYFVVDMVRSLKIQPSLRISPFTFVLACRWSSIACPGLVFPTCTLYIWWLCFDVSVVHTNVHTMAHLNVHFISMVRVRGTNGVCREDPSKEVQLRKWCGCVTRG